MLEPGTVLQNRYRIEKQIGQGGMGKVYVATDERFKSAVAIKQTIFEDANLRKAFEREARLLNSLKHSALPRVSDHFDEQNGQFLVMEFIAGEDLAERMEKMGEAFTLNTVLDWANQLCDALDYLHAQNIIHRDIKPQNLKLTTNGQIVLLDFGLAKGNATDAPHQTAAKSIFGFSRSYASLEQIQGAGTEPRSDLYSLSATLYHLLTGIPPADALTRAMNVLNGQPDPLIAANLVNREVPTGVAEVLQRAMALNAAERPASANEMRWLLEASDKTVDASAASVIEKSLSADFLTQETKIMGAKTNVAADEKSEVETRIAASKASPFATRIVGNNLESNETAAQSSIDTAVPKRAKVVGATVFGGLLLLGSVFSAGYFLTGENSALKDEANKSENINVSTIKPDSTDLTDTIAPDANIGLSNRQIGNQSLTEIAPKQTETAKNGAKQTRKTSSSETKSADKSDSESFVISDKSVEMGDVIIDENGIRDKKTGKIIVSDSEDSNLPLNQQTTKLTPEQIRKLKQLQKMQQVLDIEQLKRRTENRKKQIIVVKPPPPPTP